MRKLFLVIFTIFSLANFTCANDNIAVPDSWANQYIEEDVAVASSELTIYDPLEKYNRNIYKFNHFVDRYTLKPIAKTYRYIPKPLRKTIRNFTTNLATPLTVLQSLLQGDFYNAHTGYKRFVINSIAGDGVVFDR